MKSRDSFIFYRSFFEAIDELPENNQLEIYRAISNYSLNFQEPELTGISRTIWTLIKPQLDANNKRFINGTKPKTKQKGSKTKANQKQRKSKTEANNNVNVNVNDNVNKNVNENIKLPFDSDGFKKIWSDWCEDLKDRKEKHTDRAKKMQLKKLASHSESEAIKIIEQSIERGWKGLFDLKNEPNKKEPVKYSADPRLKTQI